jgi:MFS family permease
MACSSTGVWIQRIAQDWLMLELTDSVTMVGITTMLQFLPSLVFGLLGGLVADNYPKRAILVATQAAFLVCSSALAVLTLTGAVRPWQVFVVAFCAGLVFSVDLPTRQSIVNDLVSPAQLRNAIGLSATVFQLGALIGPALSGLLIHRFGSGHAFAVTACLYLVPLMTMARLQVPSSTGPAASLAARGSTISQLREGLAYVARRPELVGTVVLVGVYGMFLSNLPVTNAALARNLFENGAGGYGMLSAVTAAGAVIGALLASTRHGPARLRGSLAAGLTLSGLYVAAAAMPGYRTYAVVLVGIGVVTVTFMTSCNATMQLSAEASVRGRVMGIFNLVFIGGGAAGGPTIGAIDQYAGPRVGLLVSGLVPAVVAVAMGLHLIRMRRSRRLTGPVDRVI